MSFYLYLPSNSSEKFFPENTNGHYRTNLSKSANLNSDYEVALVEFSYFPCVKLFSQNESARSIDISYSVNSTATEIQQL